jgi:sugar lactone lactonase YvrE
MRFGTSAPALKPSLPSPGYAVTAPLVYAVNNENWSVAVYRAKAKDPAPLATITDGLTLSFGDCIDGEGTLYVTNEPSAGWVSEYPLGKTTPSRIITEGISEPAYCTIDASGNLWVANAGGANVTEYLKGSKKPHAVITNSLFDPVGIAIDRSGNLYVGNGYGAPGKNVEVYAPGSQSPSRTITNGVTSPCGLAVDSNGTLYVANEFQSNVEEYRSGQGDPFQTITQGIKGPGAVTVDKKGVLYVSNISNNTVVEFAPGVDHTAETANQPRPIGAYRRRLLPRITALSLIFLRKLFACNNELNAAAENGSAGIHQRLSHVGIRARKSRFHSRLKLPGFRGHFPLCGEGSTNGQETSSCLPLGVPG